MTTSLNEFAEPDQSNGPVAVDMAPDQKGTETPQSVPGTPSTAVALPAPVLTHPPSSWSLAAKASWPALPEDVRAEILMWEAAAAAQFKQYAAFKPLLRAAADRETTPEALLQEWKTIEDILRFDAESGFRLLLRRLADERGIPSHQFRQWAGALCADVAAAAQYARAMN